MYFPPPPGGPTPEGQAPGQSTEELLLDIAAESESSNKKKVKKQIPLTVQGIYKAIDDWLISTSTITTKEKLLFFQLLGSMINAGLPIMDSLDLLNKETKNLKLQRVITDLKRHIESGESLATAMRRNDDVFDDATCAVVEAGEKSGKLNEILKELVSQYERLHKIKEQVKSVMTYPVVVVVVIILLTVVIMIFVVPKLQDLFGDVGNLPAPTQILITASNFVIYKWWILFPSIIGVIFAFLAWKSSPGGKRQWGDLILTIPIVNGILRDMILSRVTRIFGFLISAGVPIMDSLKIAAHIAENQAYQEKLLLAADDLSKGILIAENISDDPKLFPTMLVNMMAIGEKTASLDSVMEKVAGFYDDQLERSIKRLSEIMEPIILMFIAAGAIFMILAIYLPILKMNDTIMG